MTFKVPEKFRVKIGPFKTTEADGNNGLFVFTINKVAFQVLASDGKGWEHVSVTLIQEGRSPLWEEMCVIKDLFWSKDACVLQFHPPESEYVNSHPYCLHLWRKIGSEIETPSRMLV
jgi:hypothetical protein